MGLTGRVLLPCVGLLAVLASAPAGAQDELLKHAINQPGTNWTFYGAGVQTKPMHDKTVPGGEVVRVTVASKGANPWDMGAQSPIQKPIAKGDVVYVAFWARAPLLADGATTPLSSVSVGQNTAPYGKAAEASVQVNNKWALYSAKGVAPMDLPAGSAVVGVSLADEKHVIDLGPVFVLDFGPGQPPAKQ